MLINHNTRGFLAQTNNENLNKSTSRDNLTLNQAITTKTTTPTSNNYKAFFMPTISFGRESDKILRIGPVDMSLGKKVLHAYPRLFTSSLRMPTEEDLKTGNLAFTDLTGLTKEQIKKTNFKKANLLGANMSGLDLSNKDFEFACMVFADLSNTNLSHAVIQHSDLSNSQLINSNLTGTDFTGSDLKTASLSKAYSTDSKERTKFDHANLSFAYLVDTKLPNSSFKNSYMYKVKINGADLNYTIFEDTDLTGAQINHNSSLNYCNFIRTNFTNSLIFDSSFVNSFIQASNLSRMVCNDSDLTESTIYTTIMTDSKFKNNKFIKAKLENNTVTLSDFQNNNFDYATLNGSVFMDCKFKDDKIAEANIDKAKVINSNKANNTQQLDQSTNKSEEYNEPNSIAIDFTVVKPAKSTPTKPFGFDKVAGMDDVKDLFRKNVINIIKYPEIAKSHNARIPNGTVLYGPGGCGKTFVINALVEEISKKTNKEIPFIQMENTESVYHHGTAQIIGKYFNKAKELAKQYGICVISIDEAERFLLSRDMEGKHTHNIEETDKMLNQLNELAQQGVYVIATTNHINMLDKNAIRTGRFDHKLEISLPTREALKEALVIEFNKNPSATQLADEIKEGKYNDLLAKLKGATFSDTTAIAEYANSLSFNEAIDAKDKSPDAEDVPTDSNHLAKAITLIMDQKIKDKKQEQTAYTSSNIGFIKDAKPEIS